MSHRPEKLAGVMLTAASGRAFETLKNAFRLWLCRRAGWPAFHNFKHEESEQHQVCRFQIEPQIFGNLLDGPDAIELRCKLRLVGGKVQLLNTFATVFRVSRDRCWIAGYLLIDILHETQGLQGPVVHGCLRRHVESITQQPGILLKHDPASGRTPKLGETILAVLM